MGMVLYQRENVSSIHLGEDPIIPAVCRETGALHVASSLGINTECGRSELGVCKELQADRGKEYALTFQKILSSW
jgi:hypothetical protein